MVTQLDQRLAVLSDLLDRVLYGECNEKQTVGSKIFTSIVNGV